MKDLFEIKCPKCGHHAGSHTGGHCLARWKDNERIGKFHVCKCELSHVGVLITIIELLEVNTPNTASTLLGADVAISSNDLSVAPSG